MTAAPRIGAALVAVFTLSAASVAFSPEGSDVAAFWPAAGVGSGLLALSPVRRWPLLAAALVVVTAAANLVSGREPGVALLFGVANTAENLVVAVALGALRGRPWLRTRADLGRLILAGAVGAITAGVLASATVVALREGAFLQVAADVAASHAASELLVLPVLLVLGDPSSRQHHTATPLLRAGLGALTLAAFAVVHLDGQELPLAFLPFLFLVACAQVLSLRELAVVALGCGFVVTILTAYGGGPFAAAGLAASTVGALVQLDLVVIALVAYPLGIAVAQTAASTAAVHREQRALRAALEREERAVTRLHEIDRVRSEFLTTVSHELRTPLTSVLGFTQMLADGTVGPTTPEQDAVLRRIDRGAHRLSGLVDNVLSVSRPEVVADDPRPRAQVDVAMVLGQAVAACEHLLWDRELDLAVAPVPADTRVTGDAESLERAVVNLLSNAVKFTPDGGSIRIDTEVVHEVAPGQEAHVLLSVVDTGIGIAARDQESVFERFYRAEAAVAASVPGTGLGLSIVKDIVEDHAGTVTVASSPGVGTTVVLRLPAT
ncbi:MAG: ATP-binding protein [Nocardioides sp.]|uniref:ATP-binding protein n=1 Tax=Nocardioides sp. TaxID=35761 RepID=UPI00239433A0|nr:ATP-binding protein [Nocardioides sp.]MDE0777314.1 ATP-binding protein [Nocardioides sp.]